MKEMRLNSCSIIGGKRATGDYRGIIMIIRARLLILKWNIVFVFLELGIHSPLIVEVEVEPWLSRIFTREYLTALISVTTSTDQYHFVLGLRRYGSRSWNQSLVSRMWYGPTFNSPHSIPAFDHIIAGWNTSVYNIAILLN